MDARQQLELWRALVRGDMGEQEAAERFGIEVAHVRRILQVAEQGALTALSSAGIDTAAQVAFAPESPQSAADRIVRLLADSPAFVGLGRGRLDELARSSTLVRCDERTPVSDDVARGPVMVADGTLLVLDAAAQPVDVMGRRAFRAPRPAARLAARGPAAVVALPAAVLADVAVVARARLADGARVGGARPAAGDRAPPMTGAMVLDELVGSSLPRADALETVGTVLGRLEAGADRVLVTRRGARPLVLGTAVLAGHDRDLPVGSLEHRSLVGPGTPVRDRGTPVADALVVMVERGAASVAVSAPTSASLAGTGGPTDDAIVGAVHLGDLPLAPEAGVERLLDVLAAAPTVEDLAAASSLSRSLLRSLLSVGADVTVGGRLLAAVADRVMCRLLVLARAELGDPPGDFAWLVFGSHARREQTPDSDQDTGLVHAARSEADRAWFARLGWWMTAALRACGYRRCPGGVMASKAGWRHDLEGWRRTVERWTDPAEPSQLIGADIGLDVRGVWGSGGLAPRDVAEHIAGSVLEAGRGGLTAARLAAAAVTRRPPSGLWGRIGSNPLGPTLADPQRRFDLKRDGVQPIVDLARVHTLARGGTQTNTIERLAAAAADHTIGADVAASLVEGLRLLAWTRMSAQLAGADGADTDHVEWADLPGPLRTQFSETFGAIRSAQQALRMRHRLAP